MNLGSFLHKIGLILGLVNGDETSTTGLTTNGFEVSTNPIIIDTSSFTPVVSDKFFPSTPRDLKIFSDLAESTYPSSSSHGTTVSPTVVSTSTSDHSSSDDKPITKQGTTSPSPGGSTSPVSGNTDSTTPHVTTHTSSNDTEPTPTHTTETSSNVTDNNTTFTTENYTGSTFETTTNHSSPIPPTTSPDGLSKGSIAAIVIGSLLAVAIVASAIVFVIKQRNNSPEHRRLNV